MAVSPTFFPPGSTRALTEHRVDGRSFEPLRLSIEDIPHYVCCVPNCGEKTLTVGPLGWGTLVTAPELWGRKVIVPRICSVVLFPKILSVFSGPILRRFTPPTRASLKSSFLHPQFLWLPQPPPLQPHLNLKQWHLLPKHLLLLLPLPLLLLTLWRLQSANPQEWNRPEPALWEQWTSRPWFPWAGRPGRLPVQHRHRHR